MRSRQAGGLSLRPQGSNGSISRPLWPNRNAGEHKASPLQGQKPGEEDEKQEMEIRIRYFASLREVSGKSEERLEVPERASVAEARSLLLEKYPRLQGIMERSLCAVNRSYVAPETQLHEGDELVFIPPMGGGQEQRAIENKLACHPEQSEGSAVRHANASDPSLCSG